MKKVIALMLAVVLLFALAACGADDAVAKQLQADSWINVNNADTYVFGEDGTGTHDDISISYSVEDGKIMVTEGTGSIAATEFTLNTEGEVPKLIKSDDNSYYVPSANYDEISEQIKQENTKILTSEEFWKVDGKTAYLQFLAAEDETEGGGWLVMVNNTFGMEWSFADNNTVKVTAFTEDMLGHNNVTQLDIINENGSYYLATADGSTTYHPYNK